MVGPSPLKVYVREPILHSATLGGRRLLVFLRLSLLYASSPPPISGC